MSKRKLGIKAMRARYPEVCDRTFDRWVVNGILPAPLYINGRRYWDEGELEQREREGMGKRALVKSAGARGAA